MTDLPTLAGIGCSLALIGAFAAVYWRIRQASFKAPQVPVYHFGDPIHVESADEVHGDTSNWRGES